MAQATGSINSDYRDWEWSADAGERARLLQSPSVETVPKSSESQGSGLGATSALGAVFIVVNAALGAGLLNFPAAFNTAGGVAAGIALQMCMLIFIIGGLVILAYCSQASNERTYQEVVWAVCGKVPGVLCEVAIAVYTFGTCIAFLIIIGDQEDKIIAALVTEPEEAGSSRWYTDRKFTISITAFLLILPLSIPKEIGFQKYASSLSVIGTWYVTAVIIIKYIWPDKELVPVEIPTSPSSWMAVFNAMPTICFGFQHEAAGGEDLGGGGDSGHGDRSLCLYRHGRLRLPDVWGQRGAGRVALLPFQRHPRRPRPGLHHPVRADLLPHPAFLRPGCSGGPLAALHRGDGGGGRGSGAEEAPAADRQLVPADASPGSLHPRHRQSHLRHRGLGRLLHLRLPRALPDSSQTLRDPRNQGAQLVGPGQLRGVHGHPGSFHLRPDHRQCHLCGSHSLTPPPGCPPRGSTFPAPGPRGSGEETFGYIGSSHEER
eukprot:XP_027321813.1 putative sodium-coupled neutral amino acid transporter 7 isoform X1 [Anas platyrhynchos]